VIKKIISEQFLNLEQIAEENKDKFKNNLPFSYISFENFFNLNVLESVLENFPDLQKKRQVSKFATDTDKNKFATNIDFTYPEIINNFLNDLNSYEFLSFLQKLTGIKEALIPDPYYFGGGLHEIRKNGFLKVHADFNYHPKLKLDRRINILIYLNKNWKQEYGGDLELWDKKMTKCERKISPVFNKIVIFNTNDYTYHGHPEALNCPENVSRKSIALYYYSNGRPEEEINKELRYHTTIYKNRKNMNENIDERVPQFKKIFGKIYIRKKI
tara:strand:+ start:55 stop:867 length:813 start_codon:yes stop_codon:yes gene_type:complete